MKQIISKTRGFTLKLGELTGRQINQKASIALRGELGAGKTTFIQGLAKGLGVPEQYYVTSPTFNIINTYPAVRFTLCHLDLYRLESVEELETTGFEDLIDEKSRILAVEWPDLLNEISFEFDLEVEFRFDRHYNRVIYMKPGAFFKKICENLPATQKKI